VPVTPASVRQAFGLNAEANILRNTLVTPVSMLMARNATLAPLISLESTRRRQCWRLPECNYLSILAHSVIFDLGCFSRLVLRDRPVPGCPSLSPAL
jgi:hypothetical protein